MALLSLTDLHAFYGKSHILQGVSLSVPAGEVVGLFGRNGVGKTTLLRSAMGLMQTVRGTVALDGAALQRMPTDQRARAGLGYMPQGLRVFPDLTVAENYRVAAYAVRKPRPLDSILALIPELRDLLGRPAGRLSGGQQQLASLMRSLATNCRVIMMDEPTEGLMPSMVDRIGQVTLQLAREGLGVLLVEQNLMLGAAVCGTIHLMDKGRLVASGPYPELAASGALNRALGLADDEALHAVDPKNVNATRVPA